jgi:acylphosphatase
MTIARRIVISGVVQGVGFRWATRFEAVRLDLQGWVRNLPDGSVEAWLEGETEAVEAMMAWAEAGPPGSEVSGLAVFEEEPTEPGRFEIRM